MKPSALRIERMLEKIEATLVPPPRKWLRVIVRGPKGFGQWSAAKDVADG
jgi:hypothetical protein